MKYLYILLFFNLFLFTSCQSKQKQSVISTEKQNLGISDTFNFDTLKGIYYGDFNKNSIRIIINYISEKHVVGFDIYKGVQRNLVGTLKVKEDNIFITLNEPGDLKSDGSFEFIANKKTLEIQGSWRSFSGKIKSKKIKLKKVIPISDWEEEKNDPNFFTNENFSLYFYTVEDSLGTIDFYDNGLCTYTEVSEIDEQEHNEKINITKGNWKINKGILKIEWNEDTYFPTNSTFKLASDEDSYVNKIIGENRELYRIYY